MVEGAEDMDQRALSRAGNPHDGQGFALRRCSRFSPLRTSILMPVLEEGFVEIFDLDHASFPNARREIPRPFHS